MNEVPDHIMEAARYYRDHKDRFWKDMYAVRSYVETVGAVDLGDGDIVEKVPDGIEHDGAQLRHEFPVYVPTTAVTVGVPTPRVEQTLSLLSEELGDDLTIRTINYEVDRLGVKHASAGNGDVARRLKELAIHKTKLGVRHR